MLGMDVSLKRSSRIEKQNLLWFRSISKHKRRKQTNRIMDVVKAEFVEDNGLFKQKPIDILHGLRLQRAVLQQQFCLQDLNRTNIFHFPRERYIITLLILLKLIIANTTRVAGANVPRIRVCTSKQWGMSNMRYICRNYVKQCQLHMFQIHFSNHIYNIYLHYLCELTDLIRHGKWLVHGYGQDVVIRIDIHATHSTLTSNE